MRTTATSTTTGGQTPVPADAQPPLTTLVDALDEVLGEVRDLAPEVAGLTLCRVEPDGPVTLGSTAPTMALLDALQHLDGGPAPTRDRDVTLLADRWPHLARGAGSCDVRSVRAVPVQRDGLVVGEVHVYATDEEACSEHAGAISSLLDDADLGDRVVATAPTADDVEQQPAPRSLRADGAVHRVIGQLVVRLGVDPIAAYDRLASAAQHGGVGCEELAQTLVDLRP